MTLIDSSSASAILSIRLNSPFCIDAYHSLYSAVSLYNVLSPKSDHAWPVNPCCALMLTRLSEVLHTKSILTCAFPSLYPQLLSMPFHLHGFDFPSISRLNDSAAVLGLLRDLNHHLPLFRDLASVSLADWSCSLAPYHSPIHANSPSFHRSYPRPSPGSSLIV